MLDHSERKSLEAARDGWKYSIQVTRWLLKAIGGWPLALCETTMEKLTCIILAVISCFLICFLLVPCILCVILVNTDLNAKVRMIGLVVFMLMVMKKQYILIARNKNINECIQNIRADWDRVMLAHEKDHRIMLNNAKFGRQLSIICAIFMYLAGIFFTTIMPICTMRMQIVNNETVRLLPFPIYQGFFDPRTTPFFEIVYFIQTLAGYVTYTLNVSICSLTAVFVMHICGQIQILMLKMEDLADGKERKSVKDTVEGRLGDIVKSHVRILRFITGIEDLLNKLFFVDVIGNTIDICFLGFHILTEWERHETVAMTTFSAMFVSMTFNIFILCYIGDVLAEQCIEIGIKSYMIEWYRLPSKNALGLTLVMTMSNTSSKLTAGKFMDLSLSSFCSIMKAAMAYLNLLRTF